MSRRAPKYKASRKGFHIIQNGRSSRGIAGHAFEPGIYKRKFPSPQDIWEHTEDERKKPGEHDCKEAVTKGDYLGLTDKDEWKSTDNQSNYEADHQRSEA
jgi:hypothetical protein